MWHLLAVAFAGAAAAAPVAANDAGLLRCRAITAPAERLACYDSLAQQVSPIEQFGREQIRTRPSPPAAGPAAASVQAPAAPPATLDVIDSSIVGRMEGWEPRSTFTLANGQVWQVTDGSASPTSIDNAKVRVKRGLLGSFFLEIEGESRTPRVRRVK